MNAEDYLEAICISLVGLAVAGWLVLRLTRELASFDSGPVTP